MAVGRLVGWLVGVVVCAPLVLCAGNQGVSRLYKRHGPAKYRPVSRGSHYLRFNYFPLSGFAASRILPRGVSLLSASISLSSSNVSSLFFFSFARPFAPPTFVSATSFFVPRASLFFASVRFDRFFFFFFVSSVESHSDKCVGGDYYFRCATFSSFVPRNCQCSMNAETGKFIRFPQIHAPFNLRSRHD